MIILNGQKIKSEYGFTAGICPEGSSRTLLYLSVLNHPQCLDCFRPGKVVSFVYIPNQDCPENCYQQDFEVVSVRSVFPSFFQATLRSVNPPNKRTV
jgi:hypothetical protein